MISILVCGDSHTKAFKGRTHQHFKFDLCEVGGATAQGAVNPNSKTNSLQIFTERINTQKYDKILIMLGEVDCGFLIWIRSRKYGISVDEQLANSVQNLFTFITNIIDTTDYTYSDFIVCGSVLPTIRDQTDKRFLGGARSEVEESQKIRTEKTLEYNNELSKKCDEFGCQYIEITQSLIGGDGLIRQDFLSENPYDHHLDDRQSFQEWIKQIESTFRSSS